jgi:aminopeptidase N
MSIFIAPSMYVQLKFYSKFIFDVTQKTMAFFEKLFGRRYPFKKYDQVWVRGMRFLAMENAGIVTFDESSLPNNPTETDYYDLAEVIAH